MWGEFYGEVFGEVVGGVRNLTRPICDRHGAGDARQRMGFKYWFTSAQRRFRQRAAIDLPPATGLIRRQFT